MPDDGTPGEPVSGVGTPPQPVPAGLIEKARFDGAIRKIEELTLRNRELEGQLASKTSEIEQLGAQLTVKDAEKTASVSERDKRLQEVVTAKTQLESELADLRAYKLKVETAKSLGRPDLIKIADKIPNLTDPEAIKIVLSDFANFADEAVKEREKQLLAGVSPALPAGGPATPAVPASPADWERHINSLTLGSPERQKAMDQYWDWLVQNHPPK